MNSHNPRFNRYRQLIRSGYRPAKAAGKVFGLRGDDAGQVGRALEFLDSVTVHYSAGEIQAVYDDPDQFGRSCTSAGGSWHSPYIGTFWASKTVQCVTIQGARCLVAPWNREFFKAYGENSWALTLILELDGYQMSGDWLRGVCNLAPVIVKVVEKDTIKVEQRFEVFRTYPAGPGIHPSWRTPRAETISVEQDLQITSVARREFRPFIDGWMNPSL